MILHLSTLPSCLASSRSRRAHPISRVSAPGLSEVNMVKSREWATVNLELCRVCVLIAIDGSKKERLGYLANIRKYGLDLHSILTATADGLLEKSSSASVSSLLFLAIFLQATNHSHAITDSNCYIIQCTLTGGGYRDGSHAEHVGVYNSTRGCSDQIIGVVDLRDASILGVPFQEQSFNPPISW